MNNLEQNALRIAELRPTYIDNVPFGNKIIQSESRIIEIYSSYNGLMPIVLECNKSGRYGITINWSVRLGDKVKNKTLLYYFRVGLQPEPEFIEAIQLACIKYFELKNDTDRN